MVPATHAQGAGLRDAGAAPIGESGAHPRLRGAGGEQQEPPSRILLSPAPEFTG